VKGKREMTSLTDTQKHLMDLIASVLFLKPLECPEDVDWALLRKEAHAHAVLPLAFSAAKQWIPKEEQTGWKCLSDHILMSNLKVSFEHAQVHNLLTSQGIPYVILKGLASASYYPEPLLRTFGDVDFLVRQEDLGRAGILLSDIGFQAEEDAGGIHIGYYRKAEDGSVSNWEMHYMVNGVPSGSVGEKIKAELADIFETALDYEEGNGTVKIPDAFHHGLILLLHTASHLTSEGIGLRHLCDWLVFADHFTDEEFTEIFEEKLKAAGLWNFAQLLTLCGIRYLGCPPKEWAGEAKEELLEALICDICNGGNFGKKDADRYQQIKYISNRGERTVDDKGVFQQLLNTLYKKTRSECTFVKKIPVLLPIGMVCTALQYLMLVLRGERLMDQKATLEKAAWRKGIYKEFGLFEPEKGLESVK
jgi:hypothetical protein